MRILLWGPVELWHGDTRQYAGATRQRGVLAALAWEPGRLVPIPTLVWRVWGDDPPARAKEALYSHLSRLRPALDPAGSSARIVRHPGGYLLDARDDEVDVAEFAGLVDAARTATAAGEDQLAADRYAKALKLRRAAPLSGLSGPWVRRCEQMLHERYWTAVEEQATCRLRLGEHEAVAAELTAGVAEQPSRETLVARLMTALFRSGRQADALAAYARVRQFLATDFGLVPSPDLRRVAKAVERSDAAGVDAGAGITRKTSRRLAVPRPETAAENPAASTPADPATPAP